MINIDLFGVSDAKKGVNTIMLAECFRYDKCEINEIHLFTNLVCSLLSTLLFCYQGHGSFLHNAVQVLHTFFA